MAERIVSVGDVDLCVDVDGDPADPAVLLVMGLGLQLVWWREDFVAGLVQRGFRVIRFDNRDVGRSTAFTGPGISALGFLTRRARPGYTLADMADDAGGLLAALAPAGAHVVGVSMGALIAQEVAIRHPGRVLSLVSIMGRPGDGRSGRVSPRMWPQFLRAPAGDPEDGLVAAFERIGSLDRTAADEADVRRGFRASLAREAGDGTGGGRQLAAIVAERDRTADLRALDVPALVVHGTRDRVIRPSGGRATARAVPGAELLEPDGMGHDLARWTWPAVLDGISRTAARGSARGR